MKVIVAGEGAFGRTHLEAVRKIRGVELAGLSGGNPDQTRAVAERFKIPHWTTDLGEALSLPGIEAVILATPSPLHAVQAIQCLEAGMHVEVEIPLALSLSDAEAVVGVAARTGQIAMCGHTRRFNPSHQWIHRRILAGELCLQHLEVQTHFLRRENRNALGEPRSWVDHLLWHHAAHTVDLFQYQTGEVCSVARGIQGPIHTTLGIALDMSIQLKSPSGALGTLSLSFNNEGPIGTCFRYICDRGTFIARYDDLSDHSGAPIDLRESGAPKTGIELQDEEFFDAIRGGREPSSSVSEILGAYRVLDQINRTLL